MAGTRGDLRVRARQVMGPALGACAIAYFAYHAVHGDRGLTAYQALAAQLTDAHAELKALRAERLVLEHRVRLLHPESLDQDMLDEATRRMLNHAHPDEMVILLPPVAAP